MKKIIYIIPGSGESCNEKRYINLEQSLKETDYDVRRISPDWYKPLSELVFPIEKEAVVFGFSFGAVVAYLIALKFPHRKTIFGSLSPIHTFSLKSLIEDYSNYMPSEQATKIAKDIKRIKISMKRLNNPFVTLAGELEEGIPADYIVPKTGHRINNKYIKCIGSLLE